jgi:CheY-like chemotaxis protein
VDVNEKAGRTFSTALRSILRQDPDILLIGEIRDSETAEIAVQAAMTGHLVLSTLHTNDAITAIPRLINLGVQPAILADSLAAVIAQRLCRILCPACKVPVTEPLSPLERQFGAITRNMPGYRAVGCKSCDFTGYRGRLPIVDIVEMNKSLRDAVAGGENRLEILEGLRRAGLKSLAASGSLRVISGDTTVQEIMTSIGPAFWSELTKHYGTSSNIADLDDLDLVPEFVRPGMAVLLMSPEPGQTELLQEALDREGLRLIVSQSAEEAHGILQKNENIAFIIGDVPSSASPEAAVNLLRNNRLHISWARLPSIVLLPPELADQQDVLRESGVMAAFVNKPIRPEDILSQIKRAQAR